MTEAPKGLPGPVCGLHSVLASGTEQPSTASRETKSVEWLWEVPKVLALGSLSSFRMWAKVFET